MDERVEISLSYKRNVSFLKRFAFYRFLEEETILGTHKLSKSCLLLERKREILTSRKNVGFRDPLFKDVV